MSGLTKETARRILKGRKVIPNSQTGKVKDIEVVSVTEIVDKEGRDKVIVNLNAFTAYKRQMASDHFKAGKLQEAINTNMSIDYLGDKGSITKFIPSVGDVVTVLFKQIAIKDAENGETFPCPVRLIEQVAETASTSSDDFFSDEEVEEGETLEEVIGKGKKA